MTKASKQDREAAKDTHSVWTGKRYAKPQTQAQLIAESLAVLRRHPTISGALPSAKAK